MDEVRHSLRDEAKRALAEVASSQTAPWIEQTLKQLNQASQETAKTLHAAWTKRLESDIAKALERVEERSRELDTLAQAFPPTRSIACSAAWNLPAAKAWIASSRKLQGTVRPGDRPRQRNHRRAFQAARADLRKRRARRRSVARSTAKIEEICNGFEKQFEMIIRERLDVAREELQTTLQSSVNLRLTRT